MKKTNINCSNKLTSEGVALPLLDSKLISRTNLKKYNIKIVECGEFTQVYLYQNTKYYSDKQDINDLELRKLKINKFFEGNNEIVNNENNTLKSIENRNIIRSKLSCERIAKSNIDKWETFITLTFERNELDIKTANKIFDNFRRQVKRVKNDFCYIAIPEFQKRGAIHYHLLCNIDINDKKLIYSQENNPKFKHIKYWNEGFTSVEVMKGDMKKVIGYVAKYMTKDIDNRLFSHKRYLYSKNITLPKASYIDTDKNLEVDYYKQKIQDKELIYQNDYINPYDKSIVTFLEFKN